MPGCNWDYPDGDWATRQAIYQLHLDFSLGLMWFLQNDPSVPDDVRDKHRTWRLADDEFIDNGHVPEETYVRETRRVIGRHILTEQDLDTDPKTGQTPRFNDSIAFNDWYMDSHSCTADGTFGNPPSEDYPYDGKLILTADLCPGQIPFRCLVPEGLDNMLVSMCISTTHVAWGAVRLEPVLLQMGEVAGHAIAQAHHEGKAVGTLDPEAVAAAAAASGNHGTFTKGS